MNARKLKVYVVGGACVFLSMLAVYVTGGTEKLARQK